MITSKSIGDRIGCALSFCSPPTLDCRKRCVEPVARTQQISDPQKFASHMEYPVLADCAADVGQLQC